MLSALWLLLIVPGTAVLALLLGWLLCSGFAAGKAEDDNKAWALLRRGYQRYAERAYRVGHKRGRRSILRGMGRHIMLVEQALDDEARKARQRTEPATLLTDRPS